MKNKTRLIISLLTVFILHITLYALHSQAAVPRLINYQGWLTDKDDKPLEGSYAVTFRVYDAEAAGNLLWEETQSSLVIQEGIFSTLLGSVKDLNLAFDKPYFLEIKVGEEVMSPRQKITSVAYAIRAEGAEKIKADSGDAAVGYLSEKLDNTTLEVNAFHKLQVKDGSLTPAKFADTVVGNAVEVSAPTEKNTQPNTATKEYTKVKEISVARNGSIRVKFELRSGGPDFVYGRIYKNGVPAGTERTTKGIDYVEFSEDLNNINAGDLIQLYVRTSTNNIRVKNFRVCVGNPMSSTVSID